MKNHIGHPKLPGKLYIFRACLHHTYLRHKIAGHIERRELNTEPIILDLLKNAIRNALRCFSQFIPGKHSVDIRVVNRPESFLRIYGIRIAARNHKNFFPFSYSSFAFQNAEFSDQLRTDIDLLKFITPQATNDTDRRLPLA